MKHTRPSKLEFNGRVYDLRMKDNGEYEAVPESQATIQHPPTSSRAQTQLPGKSEKKMEPENVPIAREPQQPGVAPVSEEKVELTAERRDRLLALKNLLPTLPIDSSQRTKLLTLLDDKELPYEEIVTRILDELEPISKVVREKREQTQVERYLVIRGMTSVQIPNDVTAELKQLGEDHNIEAHIDKISQRKAELMPTQTRFAVHNLTLDILRNEPIKQATAQQKTALRLRSLGQITKGQSG